MIDDLAPNESRAIEGNDVICQDCKAVYSFEYNKRDVFYPAPCPCCMAMGKGMSKKKWDKWHD